jgi:hypothetical protein
MVSPSRPSEANRWSEDCPVCQKALGRPPGLWLELGHPVNDRYPWRFGGFDGSGAVEVSTDPPFDPANRQYLFRLCGSGHIFEVVGKAGTQVDYYNVVAAVGPVAAGKTYLLTRAFEQLLTAAGPLRRARPGQPRATFTKIESSWVETDSLERRKNDYLRTYRSGELIGSTRRFDDNPLADILGKVSPDLTQAIARLLGGPHGVAALAARQPMVIRTRINDLRTWTGVADLSGELFGSASGPARDQPPDMSRYDGLVWVVDPLLSVEAFDRFAGDALPAGSTHGSLRMDPVRNPDATDARRERGGDQSDLVSRFMRENGRFHQSRGSRSFLMVAVSKCDLVHKVLEHRRLDQLVPRAGRGTEMRAGVVRYLHYLNNMPTETRQTQRALTHGEPRQLLDYLHARGSLDDRVIATRLDQVAAALVDHYSDAGAFWNLVEVGDEDTVHVPARGLVASGRPVRVPSIDEHLEESLEVEGADVLRMRDLVMSALGCGVLYGLGFADELEGLLNAPEREVRFFLCSSLGAVPVMARPKADDGGLRVSASEGHFASLHDRSAALTQLFLSILRRARR